MNFTNDGIRMDLKVSLLVQSNQLTATSRCEFQAGPTLTVSTSAAIDLTDSEIRILTSPKNQTSQGSYSCNVSLSAGTATYKVEGSTLTMTSNGEPALYSRN